MLEFNYEGERYFANVIEYRHSPAVYYVNLINATHLRPRRMIFEEVGNKIELSPDSLPVRENLVKAIVAKIEEHLENPSSPGERPAQGFRTRPVRLSVQPTFIIFGG